MASARATVRMAAPLYPDPADVIGAVNVRVTEDVYGTGRFLTLFYLEIDTASRTLRWVRAGHDPALVLVPGDEAFAELAGPGLPLGVDVQYGYRTSESPWPVGGVLFIGTDGIWEARSRTREMFGKDRLKAVLRQNAGLPANRLLVAVAEAVTAFQDGAPQEDDITMVVIRFP